MGSEAEFKEFSNKLYRQAMAEKKKREKDMPKEFDAILEMSRAYHRLNELGWKDIQYCPKDGTHFDAIECGSTGIHDCAYSGEWPNGGWEVFDDDAKEVYPSRPVLFKLRG